MKILSQRRVVLLIVSALCLLSFYQFSRMVRDGFLKTTDFAATVKLQERIDTSSRLRLAEAVGNVMEGSTFAASPEFSVIAVILLSALAAYDWKQKKVRWVSVLIPFCFGLLVLGEIYGKSVVHHPAPPFFMIKNPTTVFPKHYINDQFSYPSGHAARAVFLAAVFVAVTLRHCHNVTMKKKLNVLLMIGGSLGYVALVATSRIYLGHHWLSDIIGGSLLGLGMALPAVAWLR